jgi:SAM-dependent methyltransferase
MSVNHPEIERLQNEFGWVSRLLFGGDNWAINPGQVAPRGSFSDERNSSVTRINEGGSWWVSTRNEILYRFILAHGTEECLWEIGSGTGAVGSSLLNRGIQCIGVEPYSSAVSKSAIKGLFSIQSDLASLRLPSCSLGQVGLFDVLEHVPEREILLAEIYRVLKPGGKLFVSVPALKFLWSQSDLDAGHFIRYSKRSINSELTEAGFAVHSSRYIFLLLVIPLLVLRAIPFRCGLSSPASDQDLVGMNGGILGRVLRRIELFLSRRSPLGSSLMVVAAKK